MWAVVYRQGPGAFWILDSTYRLETLAYSRASALKEQGAFNVYVLCADGSVGEVKQ